MLKKTALVGFEIIYNSFGQIKIKKRFFIFAQNKFFRFVRF